ncbi:MAG: DUF502 domain-containing protein [Nitrospirota bacterium]
MKKLTRYFLEGLLFLVPLVGTIYVVYIVFIKIDHIFKLRIPGLGFALTMLTILLVGFVASNFVTRRLVNLVDKIIERLPLIRMVYTSIRDLVNAFVGDKKGFKKPVLVTLIPNSNIQVIGFVTCESLVRWGLSEYVTVYLPQSYNFAGNLIVVPKDQVTPLHAESGSVMAFIVSGGIAVH